MTQAFIQNGKEDQSSKKQRTEYQPSWSAQRPNRACKSGRNVPKQVTKPKLASTSVGLAVYGVDTPGGSIPLKKHEACPRVK